MKGSKWDGDKSKPPMIDIRHFVKTLKQCDAITKFGIQKFLLFFNYKDLMKRFGLLENEWKYTKGNIIKRYSENQRWNPGELMRYFNALKRKFASAGLELAFADRNQAKILWIIYRTIDEDSKISYFSNMIQ
jgi:hypothetical protein